MTTWLFAPDSSAGNAAGSSTGGVVVDRIAVEQLEREESRRAAREQMQSSHSSAADKIRAWERLHGLQLPRDPTHMVLMLVARRTGLTLRAVLDEQRFRAEKAQRAREP